MISPLQAMPSADSCARVTGMALMLLPRLGTVPVTAGSAGLRSRRLSQHSREPGAGFYGLGKGDYVPGKKGWCLQHCLELPECPSVSLSTDVPSKKSVSARGVDRKSVV